MKNKSSNKQLNTDDSKAENGDYKYDVFISYGHRNHDWVWNELIPVLRTAGINYCIDKEHFEPGRKSVSEMARCVKESRKTLCILSEDYITSDWCDFEAVMAKSLDPGAKHARIIPVILEPCETPIILSTLVGIDFSKVSDNELSFRKLVTAIHEKQYNGIDIEPQIHKKEIPQFIPHPYPEAPNFTGRKKERAMLTEWLTEDGDRPLLSLMAIGGMGKSSLSWRWLQEDVIEKGLEFDGIFWWSFYESHANFSAFINETISFLFPEKEEMLRQLSDREKIDRVLRELRKNKYLIIFDGFERTLRAYMSISACYHADDCRPVSEERHRQCVDPNLSWFLRAISSLDCKTKTLLTTRLHPLDLEGLRGVRKRTLDRMNSQDAVDFFHAQGIRGSPPEIMRACEKYDYLPLCLRLLSGVLITHPKFRKDKDIKHTEMIPDLDLKNVDAQFHDAMKFEHILNFSYDNLNEKDQLLISSISAFRSSMEFTVLMDILDPVKDESKFRKTLESLKKRGLLFYDEDTDRYDLHPVVRRYCYHALPDPSQIHNQYAQYFQNQVGYDRERLESLTGGRYADVKSVDELQPVIELYYHTVRAGRYDEAAQLYHNVLYIPLIHQFFQNNLVIELLEPLFPEGYDQPKITDEKNLARIYRTLAIPYIMQNYLRAIILQKRSCLTFERIGDFETYARTLNNLASTFLFHGDFESAYSSVQKGIELIVSKNGSGNENILRKQSVQILAYLGRYEESDSLYIEAKKHWLRNHEYRQLTMVSYFRSVSAILSGKPEEALIYAEEAVVYAKQHADEFAPVIIDNIFINWIMGKSHLNMMDLDSAETFLKKAIIESRKTYYIGIEAYALIDMARLLHFKGQDDESLSLVHEALEIADRYDYVIHQTDAHHFLAEFWKDKGNVVKAIGNAKLAKLRSYQMIDCESGDYITKDPETEWKYKPGFDKAERLLKELEVLYCN